MLYHKTIYIDTSALTSLKFETEIAALLSASKEGKLIIHSSECVDWEGARQYYEKQKSSLIPPKTTLAETYSWFRKVFVDYNITVVCITEKYNTEAANMIKDGNTYFKEDNINDHRDAMILSMATSSLNPWESIILCGDKNLIAEFERHGFAVREDARNFVRELFANLTVQQTLSGIRSPKASSSRGLS
jgi:hypothetical protein